MSTRGGKASAWYHFFGAAAATYDEATKKSPFPLSANAAARNAYVMGRITGGGLMIAEEFFDRMTQLLRLNGPVDFTKRHIINRQGVHFGANLARYLLLAKAGSFACEPTQHDDTYYLYDNPEIFGRNYPLRDGERPDGWGPILSR